MNIVNRLLGYVDLKISSASRVKKNSESMEKNLKLLSEFYRKSIGNKNSFNPYITGIVFSKDRAMQLHALLDSYFHYTKNAAPLFVLFTCSSAEHENAYQILKNEFLSFSVTFIHESNFQSDLKNLIRSIDTDRVFFMTDDAVFVSEYDLNNCLQFNPIDYIFSLRLGRDFDFCYTYNIAQKIPEFLTEESGKSQLNTWIWNDMKGSPDWIYPLSVDATVFYKKEIELLVDIVPFKNPNSLEAMLQQYNSLFLYRTGICYSNTKYINIPCNVVQTEYENVSTNLFSTNQLLHIFLDGKRIDWHFPSHLKPREVQLIKYSFI